MKDSQDEVESETKEMRQVLSESDREVLQEGGEKREKQELELSVETENVRVTETHTTAESEEKKSDEHKYDFTAREIDEFSHSPSSLGMIRTVSFGVALVATTFVISVLRERKGK